MPKSKQAKKQKQTRPKRTASKPKNAKRASKPRGLPPMSESAMCGWRYGLAISNPFSPDAVGACLPTFPNPSSQKFSAICNGTMTVAATGEGYVGCQPTWANDSSTVVHAVQYSTNPATYVSSGTPANGAAGTTAAGSTAPLPIANYGSGSGSARGRTLGCGLRIRYTGASDAMSGIVTTFQTISGEGMNSLTIPILRARRNAQTFPVSKDWTYISWTACDEDDYKYSNGNSLPASCQGTSLDFFGMHVAGAPPSSSFQFEFIAHCEVRGSGIDYAATPNHAIPAEAFEKLAAGASEDQSAPAGGVTAIGAAFQSAKTVADEVMKAVNDPTARVIGRSLLESAAEYFGNSQTGSLLSGGRMGRLRLDLG